MVCVTVTVMTATHFLPKNRNRDNQIKLIRLAALDFLLILSLGFDSIFFFDAFGLEFDLIHNFEKF